VMGDVRLRLEEQVQLPPFGMMTFLRFRRIA
jgi:phosphatidylethanolamine/phosphatidyl-N-methylethanolamine N-methyltransferase